MENGEELSPKLVEIGWKAVYKSNALYDELVELYGTPAEIVYGEEPYPEEQKPAISVLEAGYAELDEELGKDFEEAVRLANKFVTMLNSPLAPPYETETEETPVTDKPESPDGEETGEDGGPTEDAEAEPPGAADDEIGKGIRGELDELHRLYSRNTSEERRRTRRVRTGYPRKRYTREGPVEGIPRRVDFLIKGLEQYQIRFRGEDFADIDAELRLLLAVGDSNHPVNSRHFENKTEKDECIKNIVNLGEKIVYNRDGIHDLINEAVEAGKVYLDEERVVRLTEKGLGAIEEAAAVKRSFRGRGFNFE